MNKNLLFVFSFLILLLTGCNSYTWEDAQEADTYDAYQEYIEENPEGEHLEEARTLAEQRYWDSIKNDTTAASFESYLKQFPDGQFQLEAQTAINQLALENLATEGRVTGSNVIIRADHTTESSSVGVVAKKGTIVNILDFYSSGNSNEAILSNDVPISQNNRRINLSSGKAVNILSDKIDSVKVSFSTDRYGRVEATISKENIEPMSGERWYKITTRDNITGWIYGKFIEEL